MRKVHSRSRNEKIKFEIPVAGFLSKNKSAIVNSAQLFFELYNCQPQKYRKAMIKSDDMKEMLRKFDSLFWGGVVARMFVNLSPTSIYNRSQKSLTATAVDS